MADVDRSPWFDAVGPVWTREQLSRRLDVTAGQVASAAAHRRLLELVTSDGHALYPRWQVQAGAVVWGLAELLAILAPPVVDNWTLASWCRLAQRELDGRSVADVLADQGGAAGAGGECGGVAAGRVLHAARRALARWER